VFFIRHPKPVVDGRAVAVQVIQQKTTPEVSRTLLIVETPPTSTHAVTLQAAEPEIDS
jgi:hypothetical protein